MAYVNVPRRGFRGFGGYNDLPGVDPSTTSGGQAFKNQASSVASTVSDQSKASAISFAQDQLSNYPSAASVEAQYEKYKSYLNSIPNFKPGDLRDPSKCVDLMKQALIAYAKANGYPTTTKEAERELAAYAASIAASELGVDIPAHWPSNMKDLKSVAVDLACTAVIMYTGADPRSLTVVYDALLDGKLSPAECEAIGATAGAIAGAVIGQAFGIPAPIGAFIGGLIGKDIGGTIGQIFGAGPSGAEEMQSRIDAARSWANSTLQQANALCSDARSVYWKTFDQLLLAIELQWETQEVQIGWQFDLRWFGTAGQGFYQSWDPSSKTFSGPYTSAFRADVIGHSPGTVCPASGPCKYTNESVYGCAYNYGCPYPVVPNIPSPPMFTRVVQAFLARGAMWIDPSKRQYQCSYKLPGSGASSLLDGTAKQQWLSAMASDLKAEQAAVKSLQMLSVTIVGDLVKTAASVGAEKAIVEKLKMNTAQIAEASFQRSLALSKAKDTGKNLSDLLNYGAFALGAGLLGATLWKRSRS